MARDFVDFPFDIVEIRPKVAVYVIESNVATVGCNGIYGRPTMKRRNENVFPSFYAKRGEPMVNGITCQKTVMAGPSIQPCEMVQGVQCP